MKKVSYSLHIGLIGSKSSRKECFTEYLKKISIKTKTSEDFSIQNGYAEFLIVFKQIPIKLKFYMTDNFNELIYNFERIKHLDVLFLVLNLNDLDSLKDYKLLELEQFYDYFLFSGLALLIGTVEKKESLNNFDYELKVSEADLISKAKELNLLYCFEIRDKDNDEDISEIFEKVLSDFIFKFQVSSPELFEYAKQYGIELSKKS